MSSKLVGLIQPVELDFLISRGILNKTTKILVIHGKLINHIQDDLSLYVPFCPTINWSHGGPLIAEYSIKNSGNLFLAMRDLWFSHINKETEMLLEKEILGLKTGR